MSQKSETFHFRRLYYVVYNAKKNFGHSGQAGGMGPSQAWAETPIWQQALTWQKYDALELWPWNFPRIFSPQT